MDYAAAAEALMRRKLLERIYDRMTPEEQRMFAQMVIEQRSHDDIMTALQAQRAQLKDLRDHQQTFSEDFASNLAGNAVWAGAEWLFRRLSALIK